ncbi:MAG: PilC/PilY family type IV pilus protein [Stagnimonas sp.]|nr:PilC/PilY family type IV pilus protein [Stagnimonas sp.]
MNTSLLPRCLQQVFLSLGMAVCVVLPWSSTQADDLDIYTSPAAPIAQAPLTMIALDVNLLDVNAVVCTNVLLAPNDPDASKPENAGCAGLQQLLSLGTLLTAVGSLPGNLLGGVAGLLNSVLGLVPDLLNESVFDVLGMVTSIPIVGDLVGGLLGLVGSALSSVPNLLQTLTSALPVYLTLSNILQELIDTRVGIMLNHGNSGASGAPCNFADQSSLGGLRQNTPACSNGGYIFLGLLDLTRVDELLAKVFPLLVGAVGNLLTGGTLANPLSSTPYQTKELYVELMTYLTGGPIFNGGLGVNDNLLAKTLVRDQTIETGNNPRKYVSALQTYPQACNINFLHVQLTGSAKQDDSDAELRRFMPEAAAREPTGVLSLANVVNTAANEGFLYDGDRRRIKSYFLLQDSVGNLADLSAIRDLGGNVTTYTNVLGLAARGHDIASAMIAPLSVDTTLSSLVIAASRTTASGRLDSAYLPAFRADINQKPDWHGNLKRLKLQTKPAPNPKGLFDVVDARAVAAIGSNGRILNNALTVWTDPAKLGTGVSTDGPVADLGGAGQKIPGYQFGGGGNPGRANATNARKLFFDSYTSTDGARLAALNPDESAVRTELQAATGVVSQSTTERNLCTVLSNCDGNASSCHASCNTALSNCPSACSSVLGSCNSSCGLELGSCNAQCAKPGVDCRNAANTKFTQCSDGADTTYNSCVSTARTNTLLIIPIEYPSCDAKANAAACFLGLPCETAAKKAAKKTCDDTVTACGTTRDNKKASCTTTRDSELAACPSSSPSCTSACSTTNNSCGLTCSSNSSTCTSSCPLTAASCNSGCDTTLNSCLTGCGIDTGRSASTITKELLLYARGFDVGTEAMPKGTGPGNSKTDSGITGRPWMMGAVLHSKPLAINYGTRAGRSTDDVRVVFGSADGYLRMVRDDTGVESWGFMPQAVMRNLKTLRENVAGSALPYGVDGSPLVLIRDRAPTTGANAGKLGIIGDVVDNPTANPPIEGDRVLLFFGLRRGGNAYYALDVTDPDTPKLVWKISPEGLLRAGQTTVDAGSAAQFAKLGLAFSTPQVGRIRRDVDGSLGNDSSALTTLIFGGGYNGGLNAAGAKIGKDLNNSRNGTAAARVGTDDSIGNALFMIEAATGKLIWRAVRSESTTAAYTATSGTRSYAHPMLADSIPSDLTALDTDNDGFTDRLYVGDTGGRLWRADLASKLASAWTITPIASVGRHNSTATNNLANDRRIFFAPDYVPLRNTVNKQGSDIVLFGTGDREDPFNLVTENSFYAVRDTDLVSGKAAGEIITTETSSSLPKQASFTNISAVSSSALADISGFTTGYRVQFARTGEKHFSAPVTLGGTTTFTSYVPPDTSAAGGRVCAPTEGTSRLYSVGVRKGEARTIVATQIGRDSLLSDGLPGEINALAGTQQAAGAQVYALPARDTYRASWRESLGETQK